jgi:site-specific recombinase XerD
MSDLEPISPKKAVGLYLSHRSGSVRERTIQAHRYRLGQFREWLESEGITNLNDLTGRDIERYFRYRRETGVRETTIRGNSYTYRAFLSYCEAIEAVESGLSDKVLIPSLSRRELSRDHALEPDRVQEILEHLDQFEYASLQHVIVALLFHVGCRLGGLRALDVDDYHPEEQFLSFVHRPETGTPLKNGVEGERAVHLSEEVVELLEDYRRVTRSDVVDDHGRRPLVATRYGRVSDSAVRHSTYRVTRPCIIGDACPHDRDLDECEALDDGYESQCPSSRSPHDVRSAAIMHMRSVGIPPDVVSERVNATREVIELHYDERTDVERMEARRSHLEVL